MDLNNKRSNLDLVEGVSCIKRLLYGIVCIFRLHDDTAKLLPRTTDTKEHRGSEEYEGFSNWCWRSYW